MNVQNDSQLFALLHNFRITNYPRKDRVIKTLLIAKDFSMHLAILGFLSIFWQATHTKKDFLPSVSIRIFSK